MNDTELLTDEELYNLLSGNWFSGTCYGKNALEELEENWFDSELYTNGYFAVTYVLSPKIRNMLSKEIVKEFKSNDGYVDFITDGVKTTDDPMVLSLMGNILNVVLNSGRVGISLSDIRCLRYTNVKLIRLTNGKTEIFKLLIDCCGFVPLKLFSREKIMKHAKDGDIEVIDNGKEPCYYEEYIKCKRKMNNKLKKLTGKNNIIKDIICGIKCDYNFYDLTARKTTYDVVKKISDKDLDRGERLRPILFKTNIQSKQIFVKIKDQLPVSLITGKKLSIGNAGKSDLYPEYDYINPKDVVWIIPNESVMDDLN